MSCSGHQCSLAVDPTAAWAWLITGHFAAGAASSDVVAVAPVSSVVMAVPPSVVVARVVSSQSAVIWPAVVRAGADRAVDWQAGQVPQ